MLPTQLKGEHFAGYPPEAKRLATANLALLQRLPLAFAPLLLREVIVYDWKFPAERRELAQQFAWLSSHPIPGAFAQLNLSAEIEKLDWVNSPAAFSEQLSAHLWATHQIDAFRAAAVEYVAKTNTASGEMPLATHRVGIVVIGQGAADNSYKLFRKLRREGTLFTDVRQKDGVGLLLNAVAKRAAAYPAPYAHWYLDGGSGVRKEGVVSVAYGDLGTSRAALQARMQKSYQASVFDPEAFRSMLARTGPGEIGLDATAEPVLSRFQLSLLTEGSGTQVFSTTFVQWAAREALRRAQPLTLMARFTPRQREKPMNELLAEAQRKPESDPLGSLIDADMGAYYTWLNQQRLSEANGAMFLAWFEDHSEAVAIGPGFSRGAQSADPIELAELTRRIT